MYAIEFEADVREGVVKIPEGYERLNNVHVRVVVLVEEPVGDSDVQAFSEHSAGIIEEWLAPGEDEIWK
ncbi:hypothetical protein [Ectothiorhodospira variabilis]|uniref:hypothetical protein n=1 Tax=Ectothiorhodospira variabilis TaxID=505694 RepID=UPI001EFB337E|nr:hypothetical protein [Ectothiorhodospira variabilis]MCG5493716.1 hypothetical protein [Ectothiorhodospira variabilis]MCG5499036.1 hypothetical protein [Ectothiorhodospira variabilis]MCG5505254.1 hypothetical protein [Ectothiorhodospira variabilis]MCG5508385.1 hypothetical protein [Ectothiorhodospira variabilis]